MKRLLAIAAIAATTLFFSNSSASAQGYYDGGYQFGTGIAASRYYGGGDNRFGSRYFGFNRFPFVRQQLDRRFDRPSDLPYFSKFPPVYYSHIVKRPYGVSPFAAPSGIVPVEMTPIAPVDIQNPYFNQGTTLPKELIDEPEPVEEATEPAAPAKPDEEISTQTTWIQNPYFVNGIETNFAAK